MAGMNVIEVTDDSFDVALANPPYYAGQSVARLFVERARALLKPGGRFYLVTKQPEQVAGFVKETFGYVPGGVEYRATVTPEMEPSVAKWRSSLFMPRALSRLTLEV